MKRYNHGENCPIALMSRDGSLIGGIIKRLAGDFGFQWYELPDYPLSRNAAIVLVAPVGDEKSFRALSDKCGVWDEEKQTACACYELEVGKEVDVSENQKASDKESLTDWILTEYDFYGQNRIGFEGADEWSLEQLQGFAAILKHTLQELIESFESKRIRQ